MRRYASSKLRIGLLLVLIAGVVFVMSSSGWAQGTPAGGAGAQAAPAQTMASEVGIVVVTFNGLPFIERCLDSVRGYDTVVVDHGSTDGTPEFVRERFPEVTLLHGENRGLASPPRGVIVSV